MVNYEAQRLQEHGEQLLASLGDIPISYGFTCELPAVHGAPLSSLDRLWYDHFELEGRTWMFIVNGSDEVQNIESLGLLLEAGAAFVVSENTLLAKVTPLGVSWFYDPDSGAHLEADAEIRYWDDQLIETLHHRLVQQGKDLPAVDTIVSKDN